MKAAKIMVAALALASIGDQGKAVAQVDVDPCIRMANENAQAWRLSSSEVRVQACLMLVKLTTCGLSYETSTMLIRTMAKDPAPLLNALVKCEMTSER